MLPEPSTELLELEDLELELLLEEADVKLLDDDDDDVDVPELSEGLPLLLVSWGRVCTQLEGADSGTFNLRMVSTQYCAAC